MIGRLNIAVIYGIIACVLLLLSSHVAAKTDEIVVAIEGGKNMLGVYFHGELARSQHCNIWMLNRDCMLIIVSQAQM
jgi:glutamine amidotransferase PdxT